MRVVLDVDTGVDDGLAILFALRHPGIEVLAVTCVTGNVHVDQVVTNTLTVLDAAGAPPIPVARGAAQPLVRPADLSRSRHGADGLADLGLGPPARVPAAIPAVDLLRTTITEAAHPLTVVALGPLTNVAVLMRQTTDVADRITRVLAVGGRASSLDGGFNLRADPEAAAIVFGSGVPITVYSMDVFFDVRLTHGQAEQLASAADAGARLAGRLALHQVDRFGGEAGTLGDAGAVISLIAPDGLTTAAVDGGPVEIITSVDGDRYAQLFSEIMSQR